MPTTTFSVNRNQVITSALRKLGVLELGEVPDAETIANGSFVLNLLIKQLATSGLRLWTIDEYILPLVANKTFYTIGPALTSDLATDRPLKVIQSFLRNTSATPNIDIPMTLISKQEYNILGSKFSTGIVNSIYYDIRQTEGILHVFLTPDANTSTNYELHFFGQRPLYDINSASDVPDFPNEWFNTLVWNLADQLAIEYGVPANHRQEIAMRAKAYLDQMDDWDVETTSTFFQPDMRMAVQGQRNMVL